ncbi:MAG: hypothetical protein HC893_06125 [Chloroflexaceae bacterium]|nr:hypothetical protein [Chloroflexaceae bacterium]
MREDAARHCIETVGFQQAHPRASELNAATTWVYTAITTLLAYDDMLENEWRERMMFRALNEAVQDYARQQQGHGKRGAPKKASASEQALAEQVAALRTQYGLTRLERDWQTQRPFERPADESSDYVTYRRTCFERYLETALRRLPAELHADLIKRYDAYAAAELPTFQRQLTPLITLHSESYRDHRTPFPLHRACVALIVNGCYYLIPVCDYTPDGQLLVYPSRSSSRGIALSLTEAADGTVYDSYKRPITIDRSGRIWADKDRLGRVRPPPLAVVKGQVQAILQQAGTDSSALNGHPAVDVLLAQTLRCDQNNLRSQLGQATQESLEQLRYAPIIINWDKHDGAQPLGTIRRTRRGCGDHALSIIRTNRSVVFDMSHICYDGVWGAALSEIVTAQATALYPQVAETRSAPSVRVAPLAFSASRAFVQAATLAGARSPVEISVETRVVYLDKMSRMRERLNKIKLDMTVNDWLILARCIHAMRYKPGAAARQALEEVVTLKDGRMLRQQIDQVLEQQRIINPALLIPMDASSVDPRLRIFPATFRNPLMNLPDDIGTCARLVHELQQASDAATEQRFDAQRRQLYHDLHTFGLLLQTLRQVTMQGESFNLAALRLLAHLPEPLQHLVSSIPQKIDMLNEIVKGREVFSNIGRVHPQSSISRFFSSRDDGDTKLLVWGIMSNARGQLVITMRDFRPYIAALNAQERGDIAITLAQDYLDTYAATVNTMVRQIQHIFSYKGLSQGA